MKLDGAVFAALACAAPATLVYLFLFGLPNLQHSRYRHALWDIRDDLVDDLLDGRLAMSKASRELLLRIHLAIRYAPEHTIRSAVTSAILLRGVEITALRKILTSKAVPPDQQKLLLAHYEVLEKATVHHLLWGSPSGWLLVAVAQVLPRSEAQRHRREEVQRRASRELSALPRLYPSGPTRVAAPPDLAFAV